MNIKNEIEDNNILSITFNQDNSCFVIGTEKGFKIYQTYPFKKPYERKMMGGIGKIQMYYQSNFIVLSGGGKVPRFNNNIVVVWDDNTNSIISELKFITPIINIKLIKDLLFVISLKRIFIFNFNSFELIDTIDTGDNKNGLIAVNDNPNITLIVYPTIGELNKVTMNNFKTKKKTTYKVQEENVSFIALNNSCSLLATANEKKTFVRVHSCLDGTFLSEFYRGMDKVEDIFVCFDDKNRFLAISSNKGTIHIYSMKSIIQKLKGKENEIKNDSLKMVEAPTKVEENNKKNIILSKEDQNEEKNDKGKINKNKNINEIIDSKNEIILPENSKTFFGNQEKEFAKVKTSTKQKNICTFIGPNKIIVITYDNKYYLAEIDLKKGGLCKIIETRNLNDNNIIK